MTKVATFPLPSWRRTIALLGLAMALLFLQWHILDRAPPRWDESNYLMDALAEYQASKGGGFIGFYHAFLTTDPGRGGLLALLAQPGYFLFGPSLNSAILPFFFMWPLAIWALSDFTFQAGRHFFALDEGNAGTGAVLATLLFVSYPWTNYTANYFLTEFPLITFVLLAHAVALRYLLSGKLLWSLALGLALLGGVLAKVTFLAFGIAPAAFVAAKYFSNTRFRDIALSLILIGGPSLVIAAPFYILNFRTVFALTRFLSSAELASLYGLGGAWDLHKSLQFVRDLLAHYEFLLSISAGVLFSIICAKKYHVAWGWLLVIWISFLVPLCIVALSNFKDERYAYPAYGPLFAIAGLGLSGLRMQRPRTLALAATTLLLLPPGIKMAVTYSFLPVRAAAHLGPFGAGIMGPQADGRDWKISELVDFVNNHVLGNEPVALLGGSPTFHPALLQFVARAQRNFVGFSIHANPAATQDDVFRFLDDTFFSGILYKTPPYEPMFLGKFVPEAVQHISASGEYHRLEIPLSQPDDSHFALFIPLEPQVQIISRASVQNQTSLPKAILYNFAGRYAVSQIKFEQKKGSVTGALTIQRLGAPISAEVLFFHLLNEHGETIHGLDRPICRGCKDPADVTVWTERFYIPKEMVQVVKSIAFGIYGPVSGTGPLVVHGATTDWDGHRAIVRIPNELAVRKDQ